MSPQRAKFRQLLASLQHDEQDKCVYAHLNDFLTAVPATDFSEAVADASYNGLSHHTQNYLAAMVEQAAYLKHQPVPAWTQHITPPAEPYFAVPLKNLRLHLLTQSPPAFRQRNIFVDAGLGDRL